MKRSVLFIFCISLLAAGCGPKQVVSMGQVYLGYPCGNQCKSFQEGYVDAENQKFTYDEQCDSLNEGKKIGCLSYVHEYKVANDTTAIVFDSFGKQK